MSPRAVIASGLPNSEPFPAAVATVGANVATTAFHHTVTIQRDTETGTDAWGNPLPPVWAEHLAGIACLGFIRPVSSEQARELIDGGKTALIEERRVLVALGTDVTTDDRLDDVIDSDSAVVLAGPMGITEVIRRVSYLELAVEAVS